MANDDEDLNKYRDRAEERRKGHNPDYADKLNQMASMDAETTKYLGGDVEHTHLVKGLDYALLVKIRDEEKQRQSEVFVLFFCCCRSWVGVLVVMLSARIFFTGGAIVRRIILIVGFCVYKLECHKSYFYCDRSEQVSFVTWPGGFFSWGSHVKFLRSK